MAEQEIDNLNTLALKIGQIAIVANNCQQSVLAIFWQLTNLPHACAEAIFSTLKADSAQRDITIALAKSRFTSESDVLIQISKSLLELGQLSAERNAAIHTMWGYDETSDSVFPSKFVTHHHGKLKRDAFMAQFDTVINSYQILAESLVLIANELSRIYSWPNKQSIEILLKMANAAANNHQARIAQHLDPNLPSQE